MSKKDLTSVGSGEQKGEAASSFPERREESGVDTDARWAAENSLGSAVSDLSSVHDILKGQKRGVVDYLLIFFGYVLPIVTVIAASAFFLIR